MICWNKNCLFPTEIQGERVTGRKQNSEELTSPTENEVEKSDNLMMSNKNFRNISQHSKIDEKSQHKTSIINGDQIVEKFHESSKSESKKFEHKTISKTFQGEEEEPNKRSSKNNFSRKELPSSKPSDLDKQMKLSKFPPEEFTNNLETGSRKSVKKNEVQSEQKSETKIKISTENDRLQKDNSPKLDKNENEMLQKENYRKFEKKAESTDQNLSDEIDKNDKTRKKLLPKVKSSSNQFQEAKISQLLQTEEKEKPLFPKSVKANPSSLSRELENRSKSFSKIQNEEQKKDPTENKTGDEKSDQSSKKQLFLTTTKKPPSEKDEESQHDNVKSPQEDTVQSKIDSLLKQLKEITKKQKDIEQNNTELNHNTLPTKKQGNVMNNDESNQISDNLNMQEVTKTTSRGEKHEQIMQDETEQQGDTKIENKSPDKEFHDKNQKINHQSSKTNLDSSSIEDEKELSFSKTDDLTSKTITIDSKHNRNNPVQISQNKNKEKQDSNSNLENNVGSLKLNKDSTANTTSKINGETNKNIKKELKHSTSSRKIMHSKENFDNNKELIGHSSKEMNTNVTEEKERNLLKRNKETHEKDSKIENNLSKEAEHDNFQNKTLSKNSYNKSTNKTQGKFKLENDLKGVKYINVTDEHMPLSKPKLRKGTSEELRPENVSPIKDIKNLKDLKDRADIEVGNRKSSSTEITAGAKPAKSDDSEPSM